MAALLIMASLGEQPLVNSFNKVFLGAAGTDTDTGPSDDQFNRVSFLSHFEGSNNGVNSAFDDGSTNNHTVTANGNVTQGSFNPYGTNWAVNFSLDDNPRLSCGSSADFSFGTGDFTVEFFVFFYSLTSYQTPMSAGYSNDSGGMFIQTGNGDGKFQFRSGGSALVSETTSDAVANKWYHIAFSRQSGTLRVYRNGVQTGTASNSTNLNRTGNILIGSDQDFNINGLLSNVRLVKGTSLYNSDFTPPASALTAVTNTKLLTCQSNRFVDNSASGHTVSPNTGKETIGSFGPFLTNAVYDPAVNGASSSPLDTVNYLSIADGSWKTLGTGDFTWEFWFYGQTESTYMIGDATAGTNVSATFTLGVASKRIILYYSIQGGEAYPLQSPDSAPYYNLNEWHHVAYVRDGNDHKIYADGILRASETRSGTMVDSTGAQHIGNFGAGYASGSNTIFSDVRLVKGTAVYSGSTYTVPTAPLTAISNTELLLNFKDAQAIDSAAQNNLTLVGNANVSTDQAKFGDTSFHVPSNGDYLKMPGGTDTGNFGTGNFTIEMWIYRTASGATQPLIDSRAAAQAVDYMTQITSGNVLRSRYGGIANTSATVPVNEWVHIAIVRNSGTVTQYINGTGGGNYSSSASLTVTSSGLTLGGSANDSGSIAGYIDDIRFSKTARYTGNFTVPSEPFADKGK